MKQTEIDGRKVVHEFPCCGTNGNATVTDGSPTMVAHG